MVIFLRLVTNSLKRSMIRHCGVDKSYEIEARIGGARNQTNVPHYCSQEEVTQEINISVKQFFDLDRRFLTRFPRLIYLLVVQHWGLCIGTNIDVFLKISSNIFRNKSYDISIVLRWKGTIELSQPTPTHNARNALNTREVSEFFKIMFQWLAFSLWCLCNERGYRKNHQM